MKTPPLHALIFDFDGVIVDTEPLHHVAFVDVLETRGISISWDEYVEHYIGFDDRDALRLAHRRAGQTLTDDALNRLIETKAEAFIRRAEEAAPPAYPGVEALLQQAQDAALPVGLCSGAIQSDITPILQRLGLEQAFLVQVTADDVAVSKPDPDCYRLCLQQLSAAVGRTLEPGRAWAIEDTPAGLTAARGAGLHAVAVTTTHPRDTLGAADGIVDSLEHLNLAMLASWTS